ncbi:pilin [Thalassotalea euphylliae]|uniref:Prepilin-type N-terminal cleavage/methylation domain-containing protein n=1 Tax=Thalassotalea euphylliae TaxID=1655234 RepID=A0A3E0UIZ4_9GAMM|nr:prepilin-type N-terminal cleavage/methylation domain-containing protein [Thalassotalea euphylliae]REL36587.1 prepilin-type N-terminal cleavage/methylation domain-containing protein [Thalassotalea euphylliae]
MNSKGFTLIELMIVVAIIGILAAISLPQYRTFAEKSQFTNVVLAVDSVKSAMEVCIQTKKAMSECNTAQKIGINLATSARSEYVDNITINSTTNAISGTGKDSSASTYILTPTVSGNWQNSGSCLTNGVC